MSVTTTISLPSCRRPFRPSARLMLQSSRSHATACSPAAGVLVDLTPYFDADPLKNDLYDYAREVGVYGGKNYIVPFNSSTPVLYYNKDIFARAGFTEEPPLKTFDDILAISKTITAELGRQGISGIAAPGQFARWGLVMANDSDLVDSKTGDILLD